MGTEAQARDFFAPYGWVDVARISDPSCELYRAFGLQRGSAGQLIAPRVLARGVTALFGGHGVGLPVGDPLQMPGVFLLHQGQVVAAHRHETIADVPDYEGLAQRAGTGG